MTPMHRMWFTIAACVAAGAGWAQSPLDGNWRVTFSTEGSDGREGAVGIKGGAGTWTTFGRGDRDRKDVCVGRPFPIALTGDPDAGLNLRVDAAASVAGCRDRKATLKRVDDKTLEGTFDNGRSLKLVRQ